MNDLVVLGQCISCFIGKRGAEFCRVTKRHMDDTASTCAECESKGATVTHCHQELHHKEVMLQTLFNAFQQMKFHLVAWN